MPKESIGVWAGDALVLGYVALALLLSNWTFRHVEDRFRRLAPAQVGLAADRGRRRPRAGGLP